MLPVEEGGTGSGLLAWQGLWPAEFDFDVAVIFQTAVIGARSVFHSETSLAALTWDRWWAEVSGPPPKSPAPSLRPPYLPGCR